MSIRKISKAKLATLALATVSCAGMAATPVSIKYTINRAENVKKNNAMVLPYFFSSDTMGFNLGIGGVVQGIGQDQMAMGATGWGGAESYGFSGGIWNYRPSFSNRTFFSIAGMYAYFPEQRAYTGNKSTPTPNGQPLPGSSGSSQDQFIEGDGFSNWLDLKMEYVLPIGSRKSDPIIQYNLRGGLLTDAPTSTNWNPLDNGTTILILRQFNRYQSYDDGSGKQSGDVNAVELGIQYDNTDFAPNPSMGSRQYLSYTFEGAWLTPEDNWDVWQLDLSKYTNIGESEWASQRIFAFNFWTAYSPSWNVKQVGNDSRIVEDAPAYNEGATLGGYKRMRGYDSNRFHDKASIYASAEYRYTLKYNPVRDVEWLRFLNLDWFQLVGFVEAGQVASEYDLKDLTSDMKYDAGVSLRALTAGLVVRADYAVSEEGSYMWFMINQPF
ncbi:hypothetical protein JCM19236_542 [Vibrio sp. JCM 19236]|nr:hypothetical protein JCM19236_542 [Vibrio sp. JCM 19236]